MKALSIKQPFAQYILLGKKRIEVRSWNTHFRGTFLLCSSKLPGIKCLYPLGVTLCFAELIDSRPMVESDSNLALSEFNPDYYSWVIDHIVPVPPLSIKGKLGFYPVPDELQLALQPHLSRLPNVFK